MIDLKKNGFAHRNLKGSEYVEEISDRIKIS